MPAIIVLRPSTCIHNSHSPFSGLHNKLAVIHCWRRPSETPRRNARTPQPHHQSTQPIVFSQDTNHLQQIQQLEKRLFAKSDGWRGTLFEEQLSKRNTYMLYVLDSAGEEQDTHHCAGAQPAAAAAALQQQQYVGGSGGTSPQQASSGRVQGYIVVQVNSITAHVNKLAVAPEARRKGLATRLLQAVLQLAISERRVQCATLHVDVRNEAALGLYTKAGFVKDGTIEGYYGNGLDAHKLIVDLQESPAMRMFLCLASC